MAYPKPLSSKSIERLYRETGMSDEVRTFLHDLFAACVNLYGALPLRSVWDIYKYTGMTSPKIRRKDLVAFSSIVRREEQPYRIYEVEELYEGEPHQDLMRFIVSKDLVTNGYFRFFRFYEVMDNSADKPYYIPANLLEWKDPVPSKEETALLTFLGELKVTADQIIPRYGDPLPNPYKGKKLKEFSYLTQMEQFEVDFMKRPSQKNAFLEECSGTEAEKLMRTYFGKVRLGLENPAANLKYLTEELNEVGVELTMDQFQELAQLTMDFNNNSHLWCNAGWTPADLSRAMFADGKNPVITLGPSYQQAFADGTLDREEIVRALRERGFEVQ